MTLAVPTNTTARFKVTASGHEMTQEDPKGLEVLTVEDHVDMIGVAELTLGEGLDWTSFKIGDDVEITLGGSERKIFVGVITELRFMRNRGVDTLGIVAMDPLCKLAGSRCTKVYEEQSDSDIASAVIGQAGCSAGTVDSTSGVSKYTFQRNESHLFFLKRLAARNGYLLLANEGKIDFKAAQFGGAACEVDAADVILCDFSWGTPNVPAEVVVLGWDYVTKEKVEGTAAPGAIDLTGEGTNVPDSLPRIWDANKAFVSDVMVTSQDGATAMAKAEYNRLGRNTVRGRCVIQGTGEIYAGKTFKVSGVGKDGNFDPRGYIISSRHTIDQRGFHTEFHFCGNTIW